MILDGPITPIAFAGGLDAAYAFLAGLTTTALAWAVSSVRTDARHDKRVSEIYSRLAKETERRHRAEAETARMLATLERASLALDVARARASGMHQAAAYLESEEWRGVRAEDIELTPCERAALCIGSANPV